MVQLKQILHFTMGQFLTVQCVTFAQGFVGFQFWDYIFEFFIHLLILVFPELVDLPMAVNVFHTLHESRDSIWINKVFVGLGALESALAGQGLFLGDDWWVGVQQN